MSHENDPEAGGTYCPAHTVHDVVHIDRYAIFGWCTQGDALTSFQPALDETYNCLVCAREAAGRLGEDDENGYTVWILDRVTNEVVE